MPGYPPTSPITSSFFEFWRMCDSRISTHNETLATLLCDLADVMHIPSEWHPWLYSLSDSRASIYEHMGYKPPFVHLREFVTDRALICRSVSGYQGHTGEIWLLRTASAPIDVGYATALTTPYVLIGYNKAEWMAYFKRQGVCPTEIGHETRFHRHMKYGPKPRYWLEYMFESFLNFKSNVIYSYGLPDRAETRPHSPSFDRAELQRRPPRIHE